VDVLSGKSNAAGNQKTGLLVESIEGAESIKSGQGGWRMLSRWMKITDDARDYDLQIRNISEHSQHLAGALQQISYTLMVAAGALLVSRGELTMGGLIACSILSGRVLSPVAMIPGQLVQWAHAKAALQGLDRLWALQDDHYGQEQPIVVNTIRGSFRFDGVVASYGAKKALTLPSLMIRPGEKIHEQMIGIEDSFNTYEYSNYYKVLPAINNWSVDPARIKNGKERVPKNIY
jgi:ATP-binding cassette subfamily C protein LapB